MSRTRDAHVALCSNVYDLMRVRLWSVGPPGARFDDVIIDLRDSWTDVPEPDGSGAAARPARLMAIVGATGVGKSTLVRLISSVLVRPLPGARRVEARADQRVGHVALEWRHPHTGDLLITGRVLRYQPVEGTRTWYSFQPTTPFGLESLPFEGVTSFRERLAAALPPGDRASLTWADSYVRWREHLRGLGFAVRWWEWIADHSVYGRVMRDWTDDRFIAFVVREAVGDELLARLGGLVDEYMALEEGAEVMEGSVRAVKQSVVDLLDSAVQDVLTVLRDVQRLSHLPEGVSSGFGGSEFFRITCEPHNDRRADRLAAVVDSAARSQLLVDGVRAVADISVEMRVPNESTSAEACYLPLSQLDGLPRYQAETLRLMSFLVTGVVAARMEQERDGDASDSLGIVVLDDLPVGTHRRVLEVVSALGSQLLCTSPLFEPDLFTRFSSIVTLQPGRTSLSGESQVSVTYPAVLASDTDGTPNTGMTGVMDRVRLEDIFEVLEKTTDDPPDEDVTAAGVLTAHGIHAALAGAPVFPQPPRRVREEDLLRPGDVVLAKMWKSRVVPIIAVSEDDPQRVPSASVLVLRPRRPLLPGEAFFYLRYIQSDHLLGALSGQGRPTVVTAARLRRQLVPKPDGATLTAITHLTSAADTFRTWQSDADDAIRSFFEWADPETARSRMLEAGRLTRQRREAVSMVNEVGARLRATLPYPIARRWREVQAARPDEAGYTLVLDCAEATVAYCAVLGIVFAREARIALHSVRTLQGRASRGTTVRMTFGTWRAILQDVAAGTNDVPSDSPLAQFRCFTDADVVGAMKNLLDRRNEKSHRRGPAAHEIGDAVVDARSRLEIILTRLEWLVDHPLRGIDACRWDSFTGIARVTYRELMGDHNIVSPAEDRVADVLETGSPYIADSYGKYRLLRPFLLVETCPQCGQTTIFILDSWTASAEEAEYIALDHSDTITVPGMREPLRQVGLL